MGLSLFKIEDRIQQIVLEGTNQETGEISDEALAELESMELAREEKVINWGLYIKGERAEADAVQKQADILSLRAKSHRARADKLEGTLERYLEPDEKFSDPRVVVKWRKSSAVEIYDEEALPRMFWRQKPTPLPEPDKKAVRDAMKLGEVGGARIEHRHKLVIE